MNADLYDPNTNTFSPAGANLYPRLYHSASLLLPDATVLLIGGNPQRGNYERRLEIYSPAYLFDADGTPAFRPTITGVTPGTVGYGATFQVQTPDAAQIASVVLVRPGAATHAFDMEQRLVGLSYTAGSGVLNVTAPPNGNIAPPGYYMLFVLDTAGVPSVARFVRLAASVPNQAPTATITSPATNVTRNPGGSVSFAGTGSDPDGTISAYAWTFPGGTPASSSVANAGNVTYSTPGTYTATFRVTDNRGLTSPAATRTITVSDFSLSATPASRTVLPGGSTSLHRHGGAVERVHRNRGLQRDRSSFRSDGDVHSCVCHDVRIDDDERVDERGDAARQLSADDSGDQRPAYADGQRDAGGAMETSRSRRRRQAGRSPGEAWPPTP